MASLSLSSGLSKLASVSGLTGALSKWGVIEGMSPSEPEKATILVYENPDSSATVELPCRFRPAKITHSASNSWHTTDSPESDVPMATFKGGKGQKMTMDLFFDTTDTGGDVRAYTDILLSLTLRDSKGEPPACQFSWGEITSPMSYVETVTINYTLFLPDGTPVRAEVPGIAFVEFEAVKDDALQNPTSRSEAREAWIVREGQRLDWIAFKVYKDASQWRYIALTNGLENPFVLRPGQVLKITPLQ